MSEEIKIRRPEMPSAPLPGISVEKPAMPEREPRPNEYGSDEKNEPMPAGAVSAPAQAAPVVANADAARVAEIERILEEDLSELYFKLPEDKKAEFRRTGEETARQIDLLLSAASVKAKKIVDLIRRWLALIPGINKFFLEQEAKIKTDHLLKMNGRR